jgi:membrane-associated phospholipid phosphatase
VLPPYRFQPGVVCPLCKITPQFPEGRSGLHWHDHWSSVGVPEYVTVGVLGSAALGVKLFSRPPSKARWNSPLPLDEPVRNALRFGGASGREEAATISDVLFVWEVLHPTLIDPLLVAWWQRESPFVAWQMLVIDAQAYALTLLVNDLAKNGFARARPWVQNGDCAENPDSRDCGSGGRNLSFYSGHAAVTATGAGLLCAHHTQLSLYQDNLLDSGTCALAVLGTALTGALRIASDNHWASDVLFGHLMGYASGYLMPTLLYYKEFRATPHEHDEDGPQYTALPLVSDGALGLSLFGWF